MKKGDIILCWCCNSSIYRLTKNVRRGMVIMADWFEPLENFAKPVDGEPIICPVCKRPMNGPDHSFKYERPQAKPEAQWN